jgi:hypothetical protein
MGMRHSACECAALLHLVPDGSLVGVGRDSCFSTSLLHKAVSEKLLRDCADGRQSGWV